ncbi:hypothetical protein EK21DRAFT_89887 [Setomelanomma holmii]|uniref:Uncharacterized protein n=1 Tax=Setomelanomma holmii TaxID=210430 RepID=A0A9P4H6W5_9PLEO|nr:hypothetical protein EK21DRAFT_89887 [Setomelanomma holmii]
MHRLEDRPDTQIEHHEKNLSLFARRLGEPPAWLDADKKNILEKKRRWSVDCRKIEWAGQCQPPTWSKWNCGETLDDAYCETMRRKWLIGGTQLNFGERLSDPKDYPILDRNYKGSYSPPKDNKTYVEPDNSRLANNEFLDILNTADTGGWFHDNTMATALEVLGRITDYKSH